MKGVHVKIDSPLTKRKYILRSAIDATKLLKGYESSKNLIAKKYALIDKLKYEMKFFKSISKKLDNSLPGIEGERKIPVKEVKETKPTNIIREKPKSRDKLDMEIEAIQDKLDKIEI